MALEKSIIKAQNSGTTTFEYKPRDLEPQASTVAKSFVSEDAFISTDFVISELVSKQAGISQLADDAHRDKIHEQVLEKVKEFQEKAYQEGYDLGQVEGSEKAFQECKTDLLSQLKGLEDLLKRIEDLKVQLLKDNEATLVRLVFLTAKKIALKDLEEHREAVVKILKDVVGEVQSDERVVVRLNAQDLLFIEGLQEKGEQKIESLMRVKFIVDDNIKPGGCLIETEYGNVDATLEERVERTWQTLQGRIPKKSKDEDQ
jgi:flagellar assembly protein FliH